jgi:hypothetical protein
MLMRTSPETGIGAGKSAIEIGESLLVMTTDFIVVSTHLVLDMQSHVLKT